MISLTRKTERVSKRISVRDRLLVKEVQEMEQTLPSTCKVNFGDPHVLSEFSLTIFPDEDSYWQGGKFQFTISVPEEYNMTPPKVKCLTKLWHPNIYDGDICLSLLRQNSIDGLGWAPTRRLKDVIWGLNSLFTDLLNFDDPLNIEAAEQYLQNKSDFQMKVKEFVQLYAR